VRFVYAIGVLALSLFAITTVPPRAYSQASAEQSISTLAARVRELEDQQQIERVIMLYGSTLDARDFHTYASLFASNGVWSGSMGTFTGPAAIEAAMQKAFRRAPGSPPAAPNFHLLTNVMIEVSGDRATAVSKWTFVRAVDNKLGIALAGHYDDTFVRENGRWTFLRRVAPSVLEPAPN
jgi:ketosteroid isomerase-like protein